MSEQSIDGTEAPLNALAHRLWVYWSQQIAKEEDISEERIERWKNLWIPYDELPDGAKQTDNELVDKFIQEEPNYQFSLGENNE